MKAGKHPFPVTKMARHAEDRPALVKLILKNFNIVILNTYPEILFIKAEGFDQFHNPICQVGVKFPGEASYFIVTFFRKTCAEVMENCFFSVPDYMISSKTQKIRDEVEDGKGDIR